MEKGDREILLKKIFGNFPEREFDRTALDVFRYQARNNKVYREYLEHLGRDPEKVSGMHDIPFLPVSLFRTHKIVTGPSGEGVEFRSSGTGSTIPSVHFVTDPLVYRTSFLECFRLFYGDPSTYTILALLPSYIERGDSSLVYMVSGLIECSGQAESGFYLHEYDRLAAIINTLENQNRKCLLIGVSFALLGLVERYSFRLRNTIVMETGGMKGRRREITREELHEVLRSGTGLENIHSEYGMTEMLSQAYSRGRGLFWGPPWMKVLIRDAYDPFSYLPAGRSGGINIIDLANIDSCSFIATSDLGRLRGDGSFEVLGRFDSSDIRGCNLMAE